MILYSYAAHHRLYYTHITTHDSFVFYQYRRKLSCRMKSSTFHIAHILIRFPFEMFLSFISSKEYVI
jgi:hypothetical protein